MVDRAFPLQTTTPSTCASDCGQSEACFGPWRKAEQVNAALFLLVAVIVFVIKVR